MTNRADEGRTPESQASTHHGKPCTFIAMNSFRPAATLLMVAALGLPAAAQTPRVATATAVSTPPVIDGRLDDDAWRAAAPLTGFVQRELHEGEPVTEQTEVRLLTDGAALYVGAWLHDRDT